MDIARVTARVAGFLANLDRAIAENLEGRPVSCRKGCAGCCYMLTECGIGEAILIAAEVATWPNWRDVARALFDHASAQTVRGMWKGEWFDRQIPCPFLTRENTCGIYAVRPAACRCHLVASPPENCFHGAADPHTARYGVGVQALPYLQALDASIFREYPADLGPPFVGLFTHLALFALQFTVRGGDRRWVEKRIAKLPHPADWTARSVREQLVHLGPDLGRMVLGLKGTPRLP